MSAQEEKLFFEIECAHESAYGLKELQRLFRRVMRKTSLKYKVYPMDGAIRLRVTMPAYITLDVFALQKERLEHRGLVLHAIASDGTTTPVSGVEVVALGVLTEAASPATIPVSTVITGSHKPITFPVPVPFEAQGTHVVRSAA